MFLQCWEILQPCRKISHNHSSTSVPHSNTGVCKISRLCEAITLRFYQPAACELPQCKFGNTYARVARTKRAGEASPLARVFPNTSLLAAATILQNTENTTHKFGSFTNFEELFSAVSTIFRHEVNVKRWKIDRTRNKPSRVVFASEVFRTNLAFCRILPSLSQNLCTLSTKPAKRKKK